MSSATSIDSKVRLKPDTTGVSSGRLPPSRNATADRRSLGEGGQPAREEAGFRPWHFFLLASLMLATAAVVMSRQATPEHLILISLTIAAAGSAAAGFYRMLAPLAADDASLFSEPLTDRARAAFEREKMLALRAIKELEFDRAMGKVSDKDFDEMAGRLRARAIALMKQLEDGESGYRELIERELQARLRTRGAGAPQASSQGKDVSK